MNYLDARSQIQSGDLLAWSSSGLIGRLIRAVTAHTYSHMGIAWVVGKRVLVLEAREGRGVIIRPLSHSLPFALVRVKPSWNDDVEKLALSYVDQRYSYADAILGGLGLPTGKDNGWQCAEFCAHILRRSGVSLSHSNMTPGEVVRAALAAGGVLTLVEK